MDPSEDRTLRAKYLDWCSARIAERFLDLSPEEIYELAHPVGVAAEGGGGLPVGDRAPAVLPPPHEESYRILVKRVTEALLGRMSLPTFEQWSAAYDEAPARFDAEMLGFWKDVAAGGEPEEA
jgi:hypothetical protein